MASRKSLKRRINPENEPNSKRLKQGYIYLNKYGAVEVIFEVLQEEFENDTRNADAYECYQSVFSNTQAQDYFKKNFCMLNTMIQIILKATSKALKKKDKKVSTSCLQCVDICLNFMLDLSKRTSTRVKLAKIFIADLMYPLCFVASNPYFDINPKLNTLFRKLVFHKTNRPKMKNPGHCDYLLVFMNLDEKVDILDAETTKHLYRKLMEIAKDFHDPLLVECVFRKLVSLLTHEETKSYGIEGVLSHLTDVTFDFDHEIKGVTLMSVFDGILLGVLAKEQLEQPDYHILKAIADINANLLEDKNELVLIKILMNNSANGFDSKVYKDLMMLLLDVSIKLNREPKFVVWLLNAVKECLKQDNCSFQATTFLESSFLTSFSELLFRIGGKRSYNVLKTLMYFLRVEVIDQLNDNSFGNITIMLRVVIELLITYLNGVAIQDHLHSIIAGERFVQAMLELHELINELINKSLDINYYDINVASCLMKIIYKWEVFTWIFSQYCDYKFTVDLTTLSINKKKFIRKLIKYGDTGCKDILYQYVLFRVQCKKDDTECTLFVPDIINRWPVLLQKYCSLIQLLNSTQIMDLVSQVAVDVLNDEVFFRLWTNNLKSGGLEDNLQFTVVMTCKVFMEMQKNVECTTLQYFLKELDFDNLCQKMVENSEDCLKSYLQNLKEKILDSTYKQMNEGDTQKVQKYFKILLQLKVEFLSLDFKRIIFVLLQSICLTSQPNGVVLNDCRLIFSDLLYGDEVKFTKYVHPLFFFNESVEPYKFIELFINLLKNKNFITFIENYVNSDCFESKKLSVLLKCIESSIPKCNIYTCEKTKSQLTKLHLIVCEAILKQAEIPMIKSYEIKALILSLKRHVSSLNKNMCEDLQKSIVLSLQHAVRTYIGKSNLTIENEEDLSVLNSTKQLAIEALVNNIGTEMKKDILQFFYKTDLIAKFNVTDLFRVFDKTDFVEYYNQLHKQLVSACETSNEDLLKNFILNWKDIIQADVNTNRERIKIRQTNLTTVLTTLLDFQNADLWEPILQLVHIIMISSKLSVDKTMVDLCIEITQKSLQQSKVEHCSYSLQFCSDLLTHKSNFVGNRTSVILNIYESSIKQIIRKSRVAGEKERAKFTIILNILEKVAITLNKHKKVFGRSTMYTLANIIKWYSEDFVAPYVKESLQVCIGNILSTCDQYAVAFLRRCLSEAEHKIFDSFYDTYKKHYKFTGKI